MADPLDLSGASDKYKAIALIPADVEVDATTDYLVQTDPFTDAQKARLADADSIDIDVHANAATGTPDVTLIAERTDSASTTSAYWIEIGRARFTVPSASTVPAQASIPCKPVGYQTNFIRVRSDSTGGALAAGNKFTANAIETGNVPASCIRMKGK